jgi:hypothetical protein
VPSENRTHGHNKATDGSPPLISFNKAVDVSEAISQCNAEAAGLGLCVHSTETNRIREHLKILEPNCDLSEVAIEGMIDILGENIILPV